MARPTVEEDKSKLLAALETLGGSAGNGALKRKLAWQEDRYWRTRNALIEDGALTTGRGKGGSVQQIGLDAPTAPSSATSSQSEATKAREIDHYPALAECMRDHWLRRQGIENARANICAHQGSKSTGGKWSRPDLIVAFVETYEYVPGKRISVNTYEVKTGETVDITGVFEAAAHRRTVHNSYLMVIGEFGSGDIEAIVRAACTEQGVGLLLAEKADKVETWEELVPPKRNEPEPRDLNNTIFNFLDDRDWLKREVR
ncbi:Uncharacterised protein [Brevundimonas diminuta]|nr:Uncharacterised protein [Brevundimonas diminuta]SUW16239.1 Uncharacterised protein [Brevundimonas diminuta]